MKKNLILIIGVVAVCVVATVLLLNGIKGNISYVDRVIGYSALYGEDLINKAYDVIEKEFAKEFDGCTLTELRYDAEVENKFADEIMRYATEYDQELIIVVSTFNTDEKGGDGGFNLNDTYTNWQWHLVRTEDKTSWEIISW